MNSKLKKRTNKKLQLATFLEASPTFCSFTSPSSDVSAFYLTICWVLLFTMESPKDQPLGLFFFTLTPLVIPSSLMAFNTTTHMLMTHKCTHSRTQTVYRIQRKDWHTYIFSLISLLIYPNVYSTFPFWYLIGILNLRSKTKLLIFTTASPNLHFLPYCPYQLMTVPSFQMVWPKILELFFYFSLSDSTSNSSKYCWNHLSYCNILLTVLFSVPVLLMFILSMVSKVILAKGKSNQSLLCPVSPGALHFIIL